MEIIKLLSVFGLGGICVKVFELLFLQPYLEKKEIRSWLRDKKLMAFSNLMQNLKSMGQSSGNSSFFADLGLLAEAQLLIDDESLCERLEKLIEKRHEFKHARDDITEIKLFEEMESEVNEIQKLLKQNLRESNA
ncbi:hypothetical protein [Vibrio sp. LaRot3]|uniref:hypothetical protein n=1 Tax=Vibrio sp. LaRot3 TaxID=2998829 RepID=UPI0022CDBE1E|nr:hypothetical protein [Vibrio sp. LaRot3]MDA0148446.1 hypothetical protein [Vibrio sp. LaRot3]